MENVTFGQRMRNIRWETKLAVVLTLVVGIFVGTLLSGRVGAAHDGAAGARPLSIPSPVELSSTFSQVARSIEPSVVNIHSESIVRTRTSRRRIVPRMPNDDQEQDPFQDFFDRYFGTPPDRFREDSLGSGVVVDASGYILTNNHVIDGADKIDVRLAGDNKDYRAKIVGVDSETDLAVIKIDAGRPLISARMGNSEAAQVGDWVLAIGSPFGLDATVTAGIISYKGRPGQQQFQRFIQTDAAINRGNSGGPLVNLAGEVIGINTAIVSSQGVYAGVGFALPSNTAVEVYNQLIQHGRMVRGSIGIRFEGAASENAAILRSLGADHGVVVGEVAPGGPSERAGVRRGDVITAVDGTPVRTGDDLVNKVAATPIGRRVTLRVVRDKKVQDIPVVIEERSKVFPEIAGEENEVERGESANDRLGLTVEALTVAQAQRFGLSAEDEGVLVREVEPGGFADEAGVLRGDVIQEFNHRRVRTVAEFQAVQRELKPGDDVVFYLKRRGPQGWVGLYRGDSLPQ
jgi:serine protease Do